MSHTYLGGIENELNLKSYQYQAKLAYWVKEVKGVDLEDFVWPWIDNLKIGDWKDGNLEQPTEKEINDINLEDTRETFKDLKKLRYTEYAVAKALKDPVVKAMIFGVYKSIPGNNLKTDDELMFELFTFVEDYSLLNEFSNFQEINNDRKEKKKEKESKPQNNLNKNNIT